VIVTPGVPRVARSLDRSRLSQQRSRLFAGWTPTHQAGRHRVSPAWGRRPQGVVHRPVHFLS